jgi:small subunit ribosomal protein S16
MLKIRLFRVGKKKQPAYKIVVTDKDNPPQGGVFVEQVGFYNPLTNERILNAERIQHWISVGAQPSDTIHNMLISEKIIEGEKRKMRLGKKVEVKAEEAPKAEKPKVEEPKVEEPKVEEAKVEEPKAEEAKEEAKVEEVIEEKPVEEETKIEEPKTEEKSE